MITHKYTSLKKPIYCQGGYYHMPVLELVRRLPGYSGEIGLNGTRYPVSQLQLHRPRGHYIHGIWLRLANALMNKGGLRGIGHPCVPGLFYPQIDPTRGTKQIDSWPCGLTTLAVNVTGCPSIPHAVSFIAEPFMALSVRSEWTHFEHYIQAMKSKYRIRVRKVLDTSAVFDRCSCHGSTDVAWLKQAGELLASTLATRVVALPENIPAMLLSFSEVFGHNFLMYRYSLKGHVVGFVTGIKIGDTLHALHLGYDAERTDGMHLYERCLLDMIDLGIQMGAKTVQMGRTATEIKSTLGAEPIENSMVFFIRNPTIRWLLSTYSRNFYQPASYTLRHPFSSIGMKGNQNAPQSVEKIITDATGTSKPTRPSYQPSG